MIFLFDHDSRVRENSEVQIYVTLKKNRPRKKKTESGHIETYFTAVK